jgi:hypothetical protein
MPARVRNPLPSIRKAFDMPGDEISQGAVNDPVGAVVDFVSD